MGTRRHARLLQQQAHATEMRTRRVTRNPWTRIISQLEAPWPYNTVKINTEFQEPWHYNTVRITRALKTLALQYSKDRQSFKHPDTTVQYSKDHPKALNTLTLQYSKDH